ncbi:hypothetical protein HMPREF1475_00851 [Hoylesella oralis HGA0225]|nr:hypothetical protein HMPREF1475_00851 [Hoylesella oralis HGA0225]SHF70097.1 Tetratricopeptide repeat-containing protein [Hoylesella oralis]
MLDKQHIIPLFLSVAVIILLIGCSTQRNTAKNRWWHSFNARYNIYYNGSLAYIDGSLEKEKGNKDNFTELIPLYTVGNKNSIGLGKGNFDRTIEKCEKAIKLHSIKKRPEWTKNRRKTERDIEWLNRKEYNPFLWKAWLLMGRSQFHQGKFDEAASTFSYMSRLYQTQPAIYGRARAWLAKSYIEQGWLYDAEDVIRNMERDSIHWRAQKEWDYTYADYYIHTGNYEKAIPYLRKVIRHEMRRKQKAREWYLMGQLENALGHRELAYKAYKHVIRLAPPYEVEFNARIAMTEVMAGSRSKQMINRLKRMAVSDNNKDYLDQVYYAIGNIYLAQKDTSNAISAYEKGNIKSTRNSIEKGVLLLKLGDLYWIKEKFSDAQRCYNTAIGLLDKERDDYEQLEKRSKVLDKLVPYTDAVHLQDSLQVLAKMNEHDRNAAIDRVIEALKKKEKEEANRLAEQNSQAVQAANSGMGDINNPQNNTNPSTLGINSQNGEWYFYNQMAVNQGKIAFQKLWGKRENIDNWQRINKTVVAHTGEVDAMTDAIRDSLARQAEIEDSLKQLTNDAQNDPHKREYYLAQIPFTQEQLQASNLIIEDGLYNSGVIFKDYLDNLKLSERALRRLTESYPDYEHTDNAYYHLFLLYSRLNMPSLAESYIQKLRQQYPKSEWTAILTDPYFKENAVLGKHIEDSLYAATYAAFKADRYSEVSGNTHISETRFPLGKNRDKFIFIDGLSKLNNGNANGCLDNMKTIIEKYPESKLSEMAGMIVNGVNAGKKLRGGRFDIDNVWQRRVAVLSDSDSIAARKFSNERNADFVFMLVYNPDSVNEHQLLYEIAKYNFTSYMVRSFGIEIEDADGLHRMLVSGFRSYDEALQYGRQLSKQKGITQRLGKSRMVIISNKNLELLGGQYSYDDYDAFYNKHFAPLKVSTFRLLSEPEEIVTEKEPANNVPTQRDIDNMLDDGIFIDNGLDVSPSGNSSIVIPDEEKETLPANSGTTVIPDEPQNNTSTQRQSGTVVVKEPESNKKEQTNTTVVEEGTIVKPQPESVTKIKTDNSQSEASSANVPTIQTNPSTTVPVAPVKPQPKKQPQSISHKKEDTGIYFDDGLRTKNRKDGTKDANNKKNNAEKEDKKQDKKKQFDLEDEYYDLDGF